MGFPSYECFETPWRNVACNILWKIKHLEHFRFMFFQLSLFKLILSRLSWALKHFCLQHTMYQGQHNKLFNHAKTFHGVFMDVDRDCIMPWLISDKIFCTMLFACSLKHFSVKPTKLLVRCLNASWKWFYINLPFKWLVFNTICDIF